MKKLMTLTQSENACTKYDPRPAHDPSTFSYRDDVQHAQVNAYTMNLLNTIDGNVTKTKLTVVMVTGSVLFLLL